MFIVVCLLLFADSWCSIHNTLYTYISYIYIYDVYMIYMFDHTKRIGSTSIFDVFQHCNYML